MLIHRVLMSPRERLMRKARKLPYYCETPRDMLSFRRWMSRRENARYRAAHR